MESQENQEVKSVKFEIELHGNGEFSVKCPMLGDTLFCLGMLEMAKAAVFQHKADNAKIVRPKGGIMNFARRRFNA